MSTTSVHTSTHANCDDQKNRCSIITLTNLSHAHSTLFALTPLPIPEKVRFTVFVPTPHGCSSWKRGQARRSALERINNRIDNSVGFEKHFIRGQAKKEDPHRAGAGGHTGHGARPCEGGTHRADMLAGSADSANWLNSY